MDRFSDTQEILDLDRRVFAARLSRDLTTYTNLIDPSFIGIDAGGVLTTAAQRLAEFDRMVCEVLEMDEQLVRFYELTAIVTGRMKARGRFQDQSFSGEYRYTHVYVHFENGWRFVSAHTTLFS